MYIFDCFQTTMASTVFCCAAPKAIAVKYTPLATDIPHTNANENDYMYVHMSKCMYTYRVRFDFDPCSEIHISFTGQLTSR